jgi:catechol 1,2-dioxygenase
MSSPRGAADLGSQVEAVMAATPDPRLREIMLSLVRHLHGFVREVRLTEPEFREATALLNRMGRLTTDTHSEFVLRLSENGQGRIEHRTELKLEGARLWH